MAVAFTGGRGGPYRGWVKPGPMVRRRRPKLSRVIDSDYLPPKGMEMIAPMRKFVEALKTRRGLPS